jgi:hypothetical protein
MFGLFRKRKPARVVANDAVRAVLAAQGDDGQVPRRVMHMLAPAAGGETNETVVRDYLVLQGGTVHDSEGGNGLILEETCAVAPEAFDTRVMALEKALEAWKWQYIGWEGPLAR